MSRGALALAALTTGLLVAVFFSFTVSQTLRVGAPSASERVRTVLNMMGVLRDEHVLFEDVAQQPSSTELSRPGSFEPVVPEGTDQEQGEQGQKPEQLAPAISTVQVYLLLGGLVGTDGIVTSAGMFHLANMLRELPDTTVTTYNWNNWPDAYRAILANQGKAKIVVIGYSGGGSRATWLANMPSKPQIDLMVHYDPSPRWQMKPIGTNVKKALCYHNTSPLMWVPSIGSLGGGELVASAAANEVLATPAIETVDIAEQHFLVQVDQSLHQRTVDAVRSLLGASAQAPNLNVGQFRQVAHERATARAHQPVDRTYFADARG